MSRSIFFLGKGRNKLSVIPPLGLIHTGHTLWCCLCAVWTLPFTHTVSICFGSHCASCEDKALCSPSSVSKTWRTDTQLNRVAPDGPRATLFAALSKYITASLQSFSPSWTQLITMNCTFCLKLRKFYALGRQEKCLFSSIRIGVSNQTDSKFLGCTVQCKARSDSMTFQAKLVQHWRSIHTAHHSNAQCVHTCPFSMLDTSDMMLMAMLTLEKIETCWILSQGTLPLRWRWRVVWMGLDRMWPWFQERNITYFWEPIKCKEFATPPKFTLSHWLFFLGYVRFLG